MNGAIEFSYRGGVLRYNPETGMCWRVDKRDGNWKLVTPGTANGTYTHLGIGGRMWLLHRIVAEVFLNGGQPIPKPLMAATAKTG